MKLKFKIQQYQTDAVDAVLSVTFGNGSTMYIKEVVANDSTATNFEQLFKSYSPNTVIKIL